MKTLYIKSQAPVKTKRKMPLWSWKALGREDLAGPVFIPISGTRNLKTPGKILRGKRVRRFEADQEL
jgi:hypothetical protein